MQFTKSLFMYMRGEEILDMQNVMIELNHEYKFSNKKLEATGYFGFDTVHFIRDFQNYCGIPPTGAYDAATHQMAESKWASLMQRLNSPKPKPQPAWVNQRKWW